MSTSDAVTLLRNLTTILEETCGKPWAQMKQIPKGSYFAGEFGKLVEHVHVAVDGIAQEDVGGDVTKEGSAVELLLVVRDMERDVATWRTMTGTRPAHFANQLMTHVRKIRSLCDTIDPPPPPVPAPLARDLPGVRRGL